MRSRLRWVTAFVLSGMLMATVGFGAAQSAKYPDKPIKLLMPLSAGSISDIEGRILAQGLSVQLGQPVNVVNMTGGSTAVAASALQQEPADGYTILWDLPSFLAYVVTSKKVPYTPSDYIGVELVGGEAVALVARANDPHFKTFQQFLSYAKSHPGQLSIGGTGAQGVTEKAFQDIETNMKIKAKYIPFAGGAKQVAALLGGHIDTGLTAPSNVVNDPSLHILVVLTNTSSYEPVPSAHTASSYGYPMQEMLLRALYVKKGTPPQIVTQLATAIQKVLQTASWQNFDSKYDQLTTTMDPQQLQTYMTSLVKSWQSAK